MKKPIQQVGFYERALRVGEFRALRSAILFIFWLIPAFGLESKGGFGLCGVRPGSTWTGQHTHIIRARRGNKDSGLRAARLDRAGPQARTHSRLRAGLVRCFSLQVLNIFN